jgi:hypothetical protein
MQPVNGVLVYLRRSRLAFGVVVCALILIGQRVFFWKETAALTARGVDAVLQRGSRTAQLHRERHGRLAIKLTPDNVFRHGHLHDVRTVRNDGVVRGRSGDFTLLDSHKKAPALKCLPTTLLYGFKYGVIRRDI